MIVNLLILLAVFVIASFGSDRLLRHFGYPPPRQLKSREDWILLAMKLIMFTLLTIVLLVMILLAGINPFDFLQRTN